MKKDKKITYISFNYLIILSLLYSYSCRSTDQDNILSGSGVAPVKINLLGTEYANSNKPAQVASINNKGLNVDNNVQRYSVLLSPSSFITAELTPNRSLSPVASSKSLNTVAAVTGDQLGAGMKFRVIAYRKDNGNYQTYQDYIVGQQAAPLMLDGGTTYNMVVYSYGSTTLPMINSSEQSNISSAKIDYDNANRDLMYQKISDFTPDGNSNNTLNIKLRHKIPNITVTLKSKLNSSISSISNALIGNNYPNAKFSINSGQIVDWGSSNKVSVTFPSGASNSLTSSPVFVNNDTSNGLFSADVTISGITKTIDLVNAFKITPEYKSNLTINLNRCGAYLGPGNTQWKEFMCHNLGADLSADPFTPSAAIHGAKYQWGAKTGEVGRYISQSDDQGNSGTITGWNSTGKPYDSWSDTTKTENDPCDKGYRVPTRAQWEAVIDNNNIEREGSWINDGNYTTALYFRNASNKRTLMLPAAGYRFNTIGDLRNRGNLGYYWSSSLFFQGSSNIATMDFYSDRISIGNSYSTNGYSVRCIEE
ncbi:FISUMP domain-containing protein [uncultured Elizabethkingia sp.]|uniref:FISUMP domain-containing protein n=1 Tax=uncultured Elizabethkingia sp. TaxID=432638 RepID=UPI00259218A5|nr:FISUMP domain-containing protein [uncultured Elizabethkingia sp.]